MSSVSSCVTGFIGIECMRNLRVPWDPIIEPVLIIEADPDRWSFEDQSRLRDRLEALIEDEFPDRIVQVVRPREGSGSVKGLRRWEIYSKLRGQAAIIETLPTKGVIRKALSDITDELDALLGQILSSADCNELRKAAKLTVADMAFLGVSKDRIGQPTLTRFFRDH